MTRREAHTTASAAAMRFGKPFVVYRFPAWPPDVVGVIAVDRGLPPQAEVLEQLHPFGDLTLAADADGQGSLF